jgi:hypothetical protein
MPMGIHNPQSGIPICDVGERTPASQFDWRDLIALSRVSLCKIAKPLPPEF